VLWIFYRNLSISFGVAKGQKKVEIFSRKFHKSLIKQFLEVAYIFFGGGSGICGM
jgi:hypothetical protein